MIIIELILKSIIFIVAATLCFYIPGRLFLKKVTKELNELEVNILSISLGILLFTLLSWLFGYLHLRVLMPFTLILLLVIYIKEFKPKLTKLNLKVLDKKLLFLLLLGVFAQNIISFPSGLFYGDKMKFWGVSGRDGMWYLAITEELKNNVPPQNPSFAGTELKNYHYFLYLTEGEIARLTGLQATDLNFRFFPLLISICLILTVFIFINRISGSKTAGYWSIFMVSLSGSFGFIPRILNFGKGGWETAFWSMQPFSIAQNPQLGISFLFLIVWLLFLFFYVKSRQWKYILPLIFSAGSLIEFKVFGGTLLMASFAIVATLEVLRFRKFTLMLSFILSSVLSLVIFLPASEKASGFFIFEPFWFIRSMFASPDRLNWVDIELKRQTFLYYKNWPKVVLIETLSVLLFTIGNLGTKAIAFLEIGKLASRLKDKTNFIFSGAILSLALISFLIPLLFLQKGVAWNTIQYLYYFVFILAALSGISINALLQKRGTFLKLFLTTVLIILSLPTSLELIYSFYANPEATYLTQKEYSALQFLKKNSDTNSIVLIPAFDSTLKNNSNGPLPISAYDSTSYISAFSSKKVYFADELIEGNSGYNVNERVNNIKRFFTTTDSKWAKNFLAENKINYIYTVKTSLTNQKISLSKEDINAEVFFENEEIRILKVKQT